MKAKIIQHLRDYKSTKEWDKKLLDRFIDNNIDTAHKHKTESYALSIEIKDLNDCIDFINNTIK